MAREQCVDGTATSRQREEQHEEQQKEHSLAAQLGPFFGTHAMVYWSRPCIRTLIANLTWPQKTRGELSALASESSNSRFIMIREDLNHLGKDPGAVKLGNFINYYSFHNVEHRTNNLDKQMFPTHTAKEPFLCLDVGCNTGELSKELYQYLKTIYPENDIHMLAIDIDPTLIERAKETNQTPNITFVAGNIMCHSDKNSIQEYLNSNQKKKFDVTFCFSVTMWIHLNNGDDGLLDFIQYIKNISKSIIIEPQPWKCYRNAQRRLKKSGSTFPLYDLLKIRTNVEVVIENKLIEDTHRKVCGSLNSSWNRKILSFHDNKEVLT